MMTKKVLFKTTEKNKNFQKAQIVSRQFKIPVIFVCVCRDKEKYLFDY